MHFKSERANGLIARNTRALITKLRVEAGCPHAFKKYGFGFKCLHCGYYTGGDATLNKMIENNEKVIPPEPTIEF